MSKDISENFHTFDSRDGTHLFITDGSRIYDIDPHLKQQLTSQTFINSASDEKSELFNFLELSKKEPYIDGSPLTPPPLFSISLNVAQACNMHCGYCYADTGKFGHKNSRLMTQETAEGTVDRLIKDSKEGSNIVLGFIGGEPLLNRKIIHQTTRYAAKKAEQYNRRIQFSITTNGTLLTQSDAKLFSEFPFSVAVSIDGPQTLNDKIRQLNTSSKSSYEQIIDGLEQLTQYGSPKHLSARVTVTPLTGELLPVLDHLIDLNFDEVGFAAVLHSPDPKLSFSENDFNDFLKQMKRCGDKAINKLLAKKHYPFSNLETALHQIHRGTHRPYPCGAGAGYLSADVEGSLYACHRLISDEEFAMGNYQQGIDNQARKAHLVSHHVDTQEPCKSCWARYLCGGGCYHEVKSRGRVGCDYIRSWLDYCLQQYVTLSNQRPDYFTLINKPFVSPRITTTSAKGVRMEQGEFIS